MLIAIGVCILVAQAVSIALTVQRISDFGRFARRHAGDRQHLIGLTEIAVDRSARALLAVQRLERECPQHRGRHDPSPTIQESA